MKFEHEKLNRTLTVVEYELATATYRQMRLDGISEEKAAALLYHMGIIDGKRLRREATDKAYRKLEDMRVEPARLQESSPPEAQIDVEAIEGLAEIEEGSTTNE